MTVSTLRRIFLTSFAVLAVLGVALSLAHAADIQGSADHPLVGRYEGSEIVAYQVIEFDEVNVIEAPFDYTKIPNGEGFKTIEGKSTLIYYTLPQGRSTLEVLRNYEASLKAKGFEIVFTCATDKGTCFTSGQDEGGYYLGQSVGGANDIPKMVDDYVHNWFGKGRYVLGKLDRPEGAVYVAIWLGEIERGAVAVVKVAETKEMETDKIQFVKASEMEQALGDTGKIALYGILFDFDKDTIKPESKPTLDEIAALLNGKPDLKVKVVGHTDNQGTADYNLDLSKRRAASVVAALTGQYGIAADRLSSDGMGASQPVDTNDTDAGKAKNRRVELVAEGAGDQATVPAPEAPAPPAESDAPPPQDAPPEANGGDGGSGGAGGEGSGAPNP
jgi:outer membrane protein OmpA-like peptidoglycan-associated protein